MQFHEKLQQLRKDKGITQEELAEALYVSRTAVSKWESGRGYPSIDSLKAISVYFSVTIDDLLSSEKLLSIAEKENKNNIRSICGLLFGMLDMFFCMLIILPVYPNRMNGYVASVNLPAYTGVSPFVRTAYWILFAALIAAGIARMLSVRLKMKKHHGLMTDISMCLNIALVLFLAITREAYAASVAFLLLVAKGMLVLHAVKTGK